MVNLIPVVFSSSKLICFEGKTNEYLNQSNFSHFPLIFPTSPAIEQSYGSKTRYLSRRSILPIFGLLRNWRSVCKCMLHRPEEIGNPTVSSLESTLDASSHLSSRTVCFTFFATCSRALLCKKWLCIDCWLRIFFFINLSFNRHNYCW